MKLKCIVIVQRGEWSRLNYVNTLGDTQLAWALRLLTT